MWNAKYSPWSRNFLQPDKRFLYTHIYVSNIDIQYSSLITFIAIHFKHIFLKPASLFYRQF